jgi:hypothetical protein
MWSFVFIVLFEKQQKDTKTTNTAVLSIVVITSEFVQLKSMTTRLVLF